MLHALAAAAGGALLAACAGPQPGVDGALDVDAVPAVLSAAFASRHPPDVLLLGELHDNAAHHEARLRWLQALARERRFVLAMEQLDSDHQDAIDAARRSAAASGTPLGAQALADAARFDARGWSWAHYGPFIAFALRENLPLVAANLSSARTGRIARGQSPAPAAAEPPGWSAADEAALAGDIRDGHCGMLPASAVAPMALAQRSRDAHIAGLVAAARRASGLPVVLVAGNGHVRTDLGVPRHLRGAQPPLRVLSVGLLEAPAPSDARRYDLVVKTPAPSREDPCAGLRERLGTRPAGAAR